MALTEEQQQASRAAIPQIMTATPYIAGIGWSSNGTSRTT
jgi:hypothetical protein